MHVRLQMPAPPIYSALLVRVPHDTRVSVKLSRMLAVYRVIGGGMRAAGARYIQ